MQQHRIVIVGGGAGGLELATRLGNDLGQSGRAQIILVDQKRSHIWKPLYHEVAAGTLQVQDAECLYSDHAAAHYYQFIHASLAGIDTQAKQLQLKAGIDANGAALAQSELEHIAYDSLVLALGSVSHDFAVTGVNEHAYFLDQLHQAQHLQQILANTQAQQARIAIVGAGATGVELATQIRAKQANARIFLIEAAERVLPSYTPRMSRYAAQELQYVAIDVLCGRNVAAVQAQQILFKDGTTLDVDVCIWTAGIKAPALFAQLTQFERDSIDRIKVNASLQSVSHHDVFAIGDCAHFQAVGAMQPLGARAQVASQQAEFLYGALQARMQGKRLPQFKFLDKGSLINLNEFTAVGELFEKLPVQGALAKSMYLSLYPLHLLNIHGVAKAGVLSAQHTAQQILPWLKSKMMKP